MEYGTEYYFNATVLDDFIDQPMVAQCVYKDEKRANEVRDKFKDAPCQAMILKCKTRSKNGTRFVKLTDLSSIYPAG